MPFVCESCGRGPMSTGDTVYRMKSTGAYRCLKCANEPIPQEVLEQASAVERMGEREH